MKPVLTAGLGWSQALKGDLGKFERGNPNCGDPSNMGAGVGVRLAKISKTSGKIQSDLALSVPKSPNTKEVMRENSK